MALLSKKRSSFEKAESSYQDKLEPHCFLQCHDSGVDASDYSHQVWCCKFLPSSRDIVATCGSESVCLIDTNSARVRAKFTKPNEEFYTLDWTVLNVGSHSSNVIACGGCLGFIYLINTERFIVYNYFKSHSKPVQTMSFVPGHPTLLLSAGNEKKIYLWDIGIPSLPDYHSYHKKLALFDNLLFSPLKMITLKEEYLFCASEGGLFCWETGDALKIKNSDVKGSKFEKFNEITEIKFLNVDDEPVVDGLAIIDDDLIATKCAQTGVIFLWQPSSILKKIGLRKIVMPSVISELKWSNTEQFYINITSCVKNKILFAGDEKGSIWVYDCGSDVGKSPAKTQKVEKARNSGHLQHASAIIKWPDCLSTDKQPLLELNKGTVLNDICCSFDMSYVVAVADCNLVCIYKYPA
ncbi:leucine-rich repeat and WD repeat-containing protein 1-like [Styela clava]